MRNLGASILAIIILSGCVQLDTKLIDPAANMREVHCKAEGYGILGVVIAEANQKHCVTVAKERGYYTLNGE